MKTAKSLRTIWTYSPMASTSTNLTAMAADTWPSTPEVRYQRYQMQTKGLSILSILWFLLLKISRFCIKRKTLSSSFWVAFQILNEDVFFFILNLVLELLWSGAPSQTTKNIELSKKRENNHRCSRFWRDQAVSILCHKRRSMLQFAGVCFWLFFGEKQCLCTLVISRTKLHTIWYRLIKQFQYLSPKYSKSD